MRKGFLHVARALLAAAVLLTWSPARAAELKDRFKDLYAAAMKEGAIVYYTDFRQETSQRISAFWKSNFPGVQLQMTLMSSPAIIARVEAEKAANQHPVDVVDISQLDVAASWAQKGFYLPYKTTSFDRYRPNFTDENGSYYSPTVYLLSGAYNTKAFPDKAALPQGLQDFLDPRWKGKIVMPDPATSGNIRTFLLTLMAKGLVDWAYLEKLAKQDVLFVNGNPDVARMVASGERVVAPLLSTLNLIAAREKGQPIDYYILKEGAVVVSSAQGIISGAPHPNAAKLFTEALLTPEGQEMLTENGIMWPADASVKLDPSVPSIGTMKTIEQAPPSPQDKARLEEFLAKFKQTFGRR